MPRPEEIVLFSELFEVMGTNPTRAYEIIDELRGLNRGYDRPAVLKLTAEWWLLSCEIATDTRRLERTIEAYFARREARKRQH